MRFIPASSYWLSMVERWFDDVTGNAVRRGSFSSIPGLVDAIVECIAAWNRDPKPFIWQTRAEEILAKSERCRRGLEQIQSGWTVRRRRRKTA